MPLAGECPISEDSLTGFFLQRYNDLTEQIDREQWQVAKDAMRDIRKWYEVRYPLVTEFTDVQAVCRGHLQQYPNTPPPFVGPAYYQLWYAEEDFESQDVWNEMRLQDQKTRFSVHVDSEHWYEVHGLGLPFERLYFEAREQLVHATNALQDLHAQRLREQSREFCRTGRSRSI